MQVSYRRIVFVAHAVYRIDAQISDKEICARDGIHSYWGLDRCTHAFCSVTQVRRPLSKVEPSPCHAFLVRTLVSIISYSDQTAYRTQRRATRLRPPVVPSHGLCPVHGIGRWILSCCTTEFQYTLLKRNPAHRIYTTPYARLSSSRRKYLHVQSSLCISLTHLLRFTAAYVYCVDLIKLPSDRQIHVGTIHSSCTPHA